MKDLHPLVSWCRVYIVCCNNKAHFEIFHAIHGCNSYTQAFVCSHNKKSSRFRSGEHGGRAADWQSFSATQWNVTVISLAHIIILDDGYNYPLVLPKPFLNTFYNSLIIHFKKYLFYFESELYIFIQKRCFLYEYSFLKIFDCCLFVYFPQ